MKCPVEYDISPRDDVSHPRMCYHRLSSDILSDWINLEANDLKQRRESPTATLTESASRRNLRRVFMLRNVMIAFLVSIAATLIYLDIPLHTPPISAAVSSMMLLNVVIWLRLKKLGNISERELLAQLVGDIATLTGLFYFTGGYSNPFVWMYLLPLIIGAVALPRLLVWLLAALAMACYSMLVFYFVPLSHLHMHYREGVGLDIHLVGMWLGFVICALIIAGFVTRIGQNLREYDRMIARAREKALDSERMLAVGTLATAAAHELGTPLSTMAVIIGELAREHANDANLEPSLQLLKTQVKRCKEILTSITISAGEARAETADGQALDQFLEHILSRWQDTRPATPLLKKLQGNLPAPDIVGDRTIAQALQNLLDNAADASPEKIELDGHWNDKELTLSIRDFGLGIPAEVAPHLGTPFFSTKNEQGMGLGLYLSQLIFERFGGYVSLMNHHEQGAVCHIKLPLRDLLVREQ